MADKPNIIDAITEEIDLYIEKKLSQNTLKKIQKELSNRLDDIVRDRLNKGIDTNGDKIKQLSARYKKWKKAYTKRKIEHRPSTLKNKPLWYRKLYDTTEYKAVGVPNYGRLTGKTISSLFARVTNVFLKNNKIVFSAELDILSAGSTRKPDETKAIIDGLQKKYKRHYYDLLAKSTSNRGKYERELLMKSIAKYIK